MIVSCNVTMKTYKSLCLESGYFLSSCTQEYSVEYHLSSHTEDYQHNQNLYHNHQYIGRIFRCLSSQYRYFQDMLPH